METLTSPVEQTETGKEICGHKKINSFEDCSKCNGYPAESGCWRYATKSHIEYRYRVMNVPEEQIIKKTH